MPQPRPRPLRRLPCTGFAVLLLTAMVALGSTAHAEVETIGRHALEVPAPSGFVPLGDDFPQFRGRLEGSVTGELRLVEMYVTPEDRAALLAHRSPTLARYLDVSVRREIEGIPFTADFIRQFRDQSHELPDATGLWSEASRRSPVRSDKWGVFFAAQFEPRAGHPADARGQSGIEAPAMVLVNHRLLLLNAHTDEAVPGGKAWAEQSVFDWAVAVRAANPDDPSIPAVELADIPPRLLIDALLRQPIAWIVVALAVIVPVAAVMLCKRRRRRLRSRVA